MKENRFEGEVTSVKCAENGFCQIRITSPYSGTVYEVEIGQKALELINYNLEEVKKTNPSYELLTTPANIYFYQYESSKLEIVFTDPMLYGICFVCHSVEKI